MEEHFSRLALFDPSVENSAHLSLISGASIVEVLITSGLFFGHLIFYWNAFNFPKTSEQLIEFFPYSQMY